MGKMAYHLLKKTVIDKTPLGYTVVLVLGDFHQKQAVKKRGDLGKESVMANRGWCWFDWIWEQLGHSSR